MAGGDFTLTDHGSYAVSSARLKAAVDAVNITSTAWVSGARLYLVPVANGTQIAVMETSIAQ